jgi:isopentenyldiphosphate isomerase
MNAGTTEYFDVYTIHGKSTGNLVRRDAIHAEGLWHRTVHIWFYTEGGELIIQKRSMTKKSHPGLWDSSVAGHVDPGESPVSASVREISEELGIRVEEKELAFIGSRNLSLTSNGGKYIDNEITFAYILLWRNEKTLSPDPREVAAVKYLEIDAFRKALADPRKGNAFVPHGNAYYTWIFDAVNHALSRKGF